jgi:hypothetical protein
LYAFLTLGCVLHDLATSLSYIIYRTIIMSTPKHKKFPQMDYETKQKHVIYSSFGQENWHKTIKFLSVHTSMKHSQCFLSQQEMFLQLSAVKFSALLLQENSDIFWGSLELAYKSPSNTVKLGYSNIGFCDTLSISWNIIIIVVLIIQRYSFITTLFLGPFDDVITKFYCITSWF